MGDRPMPPEELVKAVLFVPTADDPPAPGVWAAVEVDVLSMAMAEDELGLLTPVFTEPEALGRWRPDGGTYVERPAPWIFGVAQADVDGRVVVDPGSPTSVVYGPAELAAIAAGPAPDSVPASPSGPSGGEPFTILVATPRTPLPAQLTAVLQEVLGAEPSILSAKVLLLDQGGTGPITSVFVDIAPGVDPHEVMPAVVEAISARTEEAAGLTFTLVTDDLRGAYEHGGLPLVP